MYALLRRPDQWSGGRRGVNTQEVPKPVSEASGLRALAMRSMDQWIGSGENLQETHGISL